MSKKDISQCQFGSIHGWRGDSLTCPQAYGGDVFGGCSMGCWWCFCREMEEELFTKYYSGWHRNLVRPCDPDDYRKLFDKAFGSDKATSDWGIQCLRRGLPFNMGSKAETFCIEDLQYEDSVVVPVLELFREYRVPVIFETKSTYIGLERYLDIVKDLNCAVIVAIMGGSDTLNYKLEPGAPTASARWHLVGELNKRGIWCGARWEPIMAGINSNTDALEGYVKQAAKAGAKHISFYNYRTSNARRAQEEFEKRGYNYTKMLRGNLDEAWKPVGEQFMELCRAAGVAASSPDFVNLPFSNDKESCCGTDGLFPAEYQFTFQHACRLIKENGSVSWDDMDAIDFKEPEAYARLKKHWNGGGGYFTLADSPDIVELDRDSAGRIIYGRRGGHIVPKKRGLLF